MVIFIYNELYAYKGIYWAKWETNYRQPIQILKKVACAFAVGDQLEKYSFFTWRAIPSLLPEEQLAPPLWI